MKRTWIIALVMLLAMPRLCPAPTLEPEPEPGWATSEQMDKAVEFATAHVGYCGTLEPRPGWVTADQLNRAIAAAKKKNRIVCVLYAFRESFFHSRARNYMRHKGLNGMARVLLYVTRRPPQAASKIMDQVERPDRYLPILYFATPDDLAILGFVQSGTNMKTVTGIVALVRKVFSWRNKTKKKVAGADKLVEAGRFKAARKIYEKVVKEDQKYTAAVSRTWNVILSKDEVEARYFADVPQKINALESKARQRLEQAEGHYDKREYAEAEKLLKPMVKDNDDLEAVRRAAELLTKIKEEMKSAKK